MLAKLWTAWRCSTFFSRYISLLVKELLKLISTYGCLQERGINMLFVLGGNGTHAGANAIHDEVVVPMVIYFICGHLFY